MPQSMRFGRYEVRPAERSILVDGTAVALGARAFDLLLALIERRERVASKAELMDAVWPGVIVEENNLEVQVSALRRVLGQQAIATIPGRGYRFTLASQPAPAAAPGGTLPPVPALLERDQPLLALRNALQAAATSGRVALVAGEAGIGKTSLLRALAGICAPGSVWWGACDALQTPLPLAPLLEIAHDSGARFAQQFDAPRHRLFEAVLDELRLAAGAMLVVVEDAHWADDATLDLLKFIGRRIERTRALLTISFRSDEVNA